MQPCPVAVDTLHVPLVVLPDRQPVVEIIGETKPPPSSPAKPEESSARAGERSHHPRRPVKPNAKLSAFFSVVKRAAVAAPEAGGEYFQPFFAKPDQRLAPKNAFEECAIVKSPLLPVARGGAHSAEVVSGKARWGRGLCVPGSRQRTRCKCMGADSKPAYLVAKLLQFHTSYRPAYYGTWRQLRSEISGRHPLRKAAEIDYDHDSDDDWGEDAEILDAESIAGSDEDEEEDDDDEEEEDEDEDDDDVEEGGEEYDEGGGEAGRGHRDGLEEGDELEEAHVHTPQWLPSRPTGARLITQLAFPFLVLGRPRWIHFRR